ncbi:MAG: TIGR03960 family B12-binding radical SAM protein [Candidatus Omnitrophica bacterium]|nr:TIGR03960 family B12-binding radical SAM protein [Candidatus Omnitrophota bacterium]
MDNVQKPARYTGGEINSVKKTFTDQRTSVLLAYPDTYEIGMSYLGFKILYHLLNERDDIQCERAFMPWEDMRLELRRNGVKLFSLESKRDISSFDIVGFSLAYELSYTNVLEMLSLGGITIRSSERKDDEPLVIAGGTSAYNPEPMSAFIDAFLLGDGEEALPVFIDEYKKIKAATSDRKKILKHLVRLPGVYVPSFYEAKYAGGKYLGLYPLFEDVPSSIRRSTVTDFEHSYYPVKQITPITRIIHDRIAVEIMRGCPHKCRFCQASFTNTPLRTRTIGRVMEICKATYENTGYDRISLLSLSSVNYPHLAELVKEIIKEFDSLGVGVSIPSLRVDEKFYALPEMMSTLRKTGLTFAPESADDGIRKAIRKDIDTEVLCKSASLAYEHGWRRLKLYFMVGFPVESIDDEVKKIAYLARHLSDLKRIVSSGAAEIKVSVNPFIPKAHTPLQWVGIRKKEDLIRAKNILIASSTRKVSIEIHDIPQSILEACISRGNRKTGEVIFKAWTLGARLDSWADFFDFNIWEKAFSDAGMNIYDEAYRRYSFDEKLPWDHIDTGIAKDVLIEEFKKSGFKLT